MLTVHATIEEEIFYLAAREALSELELLNEAEMEYASAKDLIAQILLMDPLDLLYDAKVAVLVSTLITTSRKKRMRCFPKPKRPG